MLPAATTTTTVRCHDLSRTIDSPRRCPPPISNIRSLPSSPNSLPRSPRQEAITDEAIDPTPREIFDLFVAPSFDVDTERETRELLSSPLRRFHDSRQHHSSAITRTAARETRSVEDRARLSPSSVRPPATSPSTFHLRRRPSSTCPPRPDTRARASRSRGSTDRTRLGEGKKREKKWRREERRGRGPSQGAAVGRRTAWLAVVRGAMTVLPPTNAANAPTKQPRSSGRALSLRHPPHPTFAFSAPSSLLPASAPPTQY